jgi:periplasmic copper chaperone A
LSSMKTSALLAALVFTVCVSASAHEFTAGPLTIDHPWSRATPTGAEVGSGYFVVTNGGSEPDRLIGGRTDIAERFELHVSETVDGVVRMRRAEGGVEIPARAVVTIGPGGIHAMLVGLRRPLKEGDSYPATLVFERAGDVAVTFRIEGLTYRAPTSGAEPNGDGSHSAHGGGS